MKRLLLVVLFPFLISSMDRDESVDTVSTTTVGMSTEQIVDWCMSDCRESFSNYDSLRELSATVDRTNDYNDSEESK